VYEFLPFGLKLGSNQGISSHGCPLERHPNWALKEGPGPSTLCWASTDGRSVSVSQVSDQVVRIIAFSGLNGINGVISATVAAVTTDANTWVLPLAARMINLNNLIAARWAADTYQVVQRRLGTWTTLWEGGTPHIGDVVEFSLVDGTWTLTVNGTQLQTGTTTIAQNAGWWGVSTHRSDGYLDKTLFHNFAGFATNAVDWDLDGLPDEVLTGGYAVGGVSEDADSYNIMTAGQLKIIPK